MSKRFTNALVALLLGINYANAETVYPLTITDGLDNPVTLNEQPQRVSSKTLFTDEILLDLLDHHQLTSITKLASDNNFSNIVHRLPANLPQLDLNVEAIISNAPDLVFAARWSDTGKIQQLKQADINVYLVKTPITIEAIQAEINTIAWLLDVTRRGQALIAAMNSQLQALSDKREKLAEQGWTSLDYNSWGTASGADTTWNAVLEAAGIINGAAPYSQGAFGQVAMSKELIVTINPDVLFIPAWISGDDNAAAAFRDQILQDQALKSVQAIKSGRVYQVPEALRGTYSQYIVNAIQYVIETVGAELN